MVDFVDDFFVLEELVVARLQSKMPELVDVLTEGDIVLNDDNLPCPKRSPTALIEMVDDDLLDNTIALSEGQQHAYQQFRIWLVVQGRPTECNGYTLRRLAGPLITKLLGARGFLDSAGVKRDHVYGVIPGWRPSNWHGPCEWVQGPEIYYAESIPYGYFPYQFRTLIHTLGAEDASC